MLVRQLITALVLVSLGGAAMALEEPSYEVLRSTDAYEIRAYDSYIVAEVDVDASARSAGNQAFRVLAGYIFGDNQDEQKMKMTAPVESEERQDGGYTYAFVMEGGYTIDTLPKPNDPRIRLVQKEPQVVAAHRYSGRWSESNYEKNTAELKAALDVDGIAAIGKPMLARYNSPFTPWFARRNEVLIEVDWEASATAAAN